MRSNNPYILKARIAAQALSEKLEAERKADLDQFETVLEPYTDSELKAIAAAVDETFPDGEDTLEYIRQWEIECKVKVTEEVTMTKNEPTADENEGTDEETPNTITYTVPTGCLSALINADVSGLDEEEIEALNAFLEREGLSNEAGHWSLPEDIDAEKYFKHQNDITRWLGDEVVDIQWVIRKGEG